MLFSSVTIFCCSRSFDDLWIICFKIFVVFGVQLIYMCSTSLSIHLTFHMSRTLARKRKGRNLFLIDQDIEKVQSSFITKDFRLNQFKWINLLTLAIQGNSLYCIIFPDLFFRHSVRIKLNLHFIWSFTLFLLKN